MPPGGWVDGEFPDTGESPEEHAYVIYVKPSAERGWNQNRVQVLCPSTKIALVNESGPL